MSGDLGWEAAEIGRLLYTHRLDPLLAVGALAIDADAAAALAAGTIGGEVLPPARLPHARLLLNILVRIEVRCGHDPIAIRAALERPVDELDGASIGDRLRGEVTIADLRALRLAAGTLPIPKVKMWRVADRYS